MRILVVTTHTPLPWEDGAGAYLASMLNYFASKGHRIDVLWLHPHDHIRWKGIWNYGEAFHPRIRLRSPGALPVGKKLFFPATYWLPFKARTLFRVKSCLQFIGLKVGRSGAQAKNQTSIPVKRNWRSKPSYADLNTVRACVSRTQPDLILANLPWMSLALTTPGLELTRKVILCHDVQHHKAALDAGPGGADYTIDDERQDLAAADELWAISESDAEVLQELAPHAKVRVAPMAQEPKPLDSSQEIDGRCLLVGSNNTFNQEGLKWLLSHVWPIVLDQMPQANLELCGSLGTSEKPDGPPKVLFTGCVADLKAHYEKAQIVLAPLKRGTGIKIKVVEAASYAKPVVGTPVAFTGLNAFSQACGEYDSPELFAGRIVELLGSADLRMCCGQELAEQVRRYFSTDACYRNLVT